MLIRPFNRPTGANKKSTDHTFAWNSAGESNMPVCHDMTERNQESGAPGSLRSRRLIATDCSGERSRPSFLGYAVVGAKDIDRHWAGAIRQAC